MIERALPCSLDAERLLLGSALLDETAMVTLRAVVEPADWSLESHRRIWSAMAAMFDEARAINRVTLYEELRRCGHAESVGGLTYLAELDEGLPRLSSIEGYLITVKEKALLRKMIERAVAIEMRCFAGDERAAVLFESGLREWTDLAPSTQSDFDTLTEIIGRVGWEKIVGSRASRGGVPLPWEGPQRIAQGMLPEELIILAGPTGYGKTSIALQIATHAAKLYPERASVVLSLEMGSASVFSRAINQEAMVDGRRARGGYLNATERHAQVEAGECLQATNLRVMDAPGATAPIVRAKLRKLSMRMPLSLVVIDYLQLVGGTSKHDNREQEVGGNARQFKQMATEFRCPFLVLSQFNRAAETEKRKPGLRDLRESGQLEQHANSVWFLWPDANRANSCDPTSPIKPVEWIFPKQRDGESGISWPMNFHSHMQRFEEVGRHMEACA